MIVVSPPVKTSGEQVSSVSTAVSPVGATSAGTGSGRFGGESLVTE